MTSDDNCRHSFVDKIISFNNETTEVISQINALLRSDGQIYRYAAG